MPQGGKKEMALDSRPLLCAQELQKGVFYDSEFLSTFWEKYTEIFSKIL